MSYVGKVTAGGTTHLVGSTLYGTCATAAATAQKDVTCSDFDELITGATIHVKFTYSNTAATPTLKVGSTAAKNIYKYGTTKPGTTAATSWQAGSVISFTYDGSYWQMNDHLDDTNTQTVSSVAGKTGAVTLTSSDVGLGNVGNFKAVSTVASQGLTATEQSNARANIGAGTSSLTLGTTSTTALKGDTKYAGASTAGGAATSAAKLTNTAKIGDTNKPVYFTASGVPAAISYTIDKSVPNDAVFTDTTYTIATGDSNGQIKVTPLGGTAYNVSVKGLGSNAYTSTAYLPLTGETMTGKISWMPDSEDASNTGLYWKENGYGDKFAIYPQFAGSEDDNGLIIGGALGTSGTDPALEEFMSILPSGVVKIKSQSYTSNGLPTIDTSTNNHYTSTTNYASGLEAVDTNNWYFARFKGWANDSGDTAAVISARNYKTDGTLVQNNFNVKVKKDGSMTYEISSPSAFRSALDLGAAATLNTSGTYTSTGTEVFTRAGAHNLYNDVISANNRLHSMGYKKWMAANETQSNIAGSNGCGIIFSTGRMATYQVAGNAGSYAVTITAIGSGGAIGDWFTITCNATTGLLTVKNKSTAARYFVMIGAC